MRMMMMTMTKWKNWEKPPPTIVTVTSPSYSHTDMFQFDTTIHTYSSSYPHIWTTIWTIISSYRWIIISYPHHILTPGTLEPTYRQLQTMKLDKSPFVIISVIGQELLAQVIKQARKPRS